MTPSQDLHDVLVSRPFRLARVDPLVLSRCELRGPLWRTPWPGVRAWAGTDPDNPWQRVMESSMLLPEGAAVGSWGAAYVHGALDYDGLNPRTLAPLPVVACLGKSQRIRHRPGVVLLRSDNCEGDVVMRGGVPVTSAARTAFDLARTATSLADAVAGIDAMLHVGLDPHELSTFIAGRRGWRGVAQARAALALSSPHAASRPESWLRVAWVVDAGLPAPEVNRGVLSDDWVFLGEADLLDVGSGMIGEYDGRDHRAVERQTRDNVRAEVLERHGLTVSRYTSVDLLHHQRRLVWRMRETYGRAVAVQPSRRRWVLAPRKPPREPPIKPLRMEPRAQNATSVSDTPGCR